MLDLTGKVDSAGPPTGVLTAAEHNDHAQEAKNLLTYATLTPSGADPDQLSKSVAQLSQVTDYYTAGGTANVITLTVVGRPGAVSYVVGLRVRFLPTASNTGATTVNVNALGVKDLRRPDNTNLQSGDLSTNRLAEAYYDGTRFRLTPGALPVSTAALPSGYIAGLTFTPSGADLTHDVVFAAGQCRDATNAANLLQASALTKAFDGASIALGTGQCGFPTVSLTRAAATWYRVFVVGHTDGRVDFGFDTSATAANLRADLVSIDAAGWNYYRQLGWIRTNGTSDFVPFVQYATDPGVFQWIDRDVVAFNGTLVTARTARSLSAHCPPNAVAEIHVTIEPPSGASAERRNLLLTDKTQADYTPSNTRHTLTTQSAAGAGTNAWTPMGTALVEVDASSEVYERWDEAESWTRTLQVGRFRFAR